MKKNYRKNKLTVEELKIIGEKTTLSEEELWSKFINAKKLEGVSDRTIKHYHTIKRVMKRDIMLKQINKEMHELTTEDIEGLILYWVDEVAIATVNNRIRVIKVYYKTLYKLKYLPSEPMRNIHQLKEKEQIKPTLTKPEIKKITTKLKNRGTYAGYRDLVIFQLFLDTGIRLGELESILKEDINEDSITIRETKSKTQRVVYPSKSMMAAIESYLLIRKEFKSPYLFVTNSGSQLKRRTIQQNIALHGREAKIEKRVSPHMLRRTYAKFSIMNGIDPFSLATLLGHSDLQTTKRYVQIWGVDLKKQSQRREDLSSYF